MLVINVAVVTQETRRGSHLSGRWESSLRQRTNTSIGAPPRPSVTLCPPYERQIVRAISEGSERLWPCSEAVEEVAAHRQALLAASHTLLSPHAHSLHLVSI